MATKDLYERIEQKLSDLKMSARAASLASGKGSDVIRNLQRAVRSNSEFEFRTGTLEALANVLQTSPEWLLSGSGPDIVTYSKKVSKDDDGMMSIFETRDIDGDRFQVSDYVLKYIPRPIMLANSVDAYGIVVENEAMAPAYEQGDVVLIEPRRGGRLWRDVLVNFWDENQSCAIRRLDRTADGPVLRRFNPPGDELAPKPVGLSVIVARLHNFG